MEDRDRIEYRPVGLSQLQWILVKLDHWSIRSCIQIIRYLHKRYGRNLSSLHWSWYGLFRDTRRCCTGYQLLRPDLL